MVRVSQAVYLGFDFGLKRIGVAVGQRITRSATPLTLLRAHHGVPQWHVIKGLIDEWGVDALIVGLPLNMDGTEQPITQRAQLFGEQLKTQFMLPVYFMDERLTTIAAKDILHTHLKGAAHHRVDSISAQLIVESWMREVAIDV